MKMHPVVSDWEKDTKYQGLMPEQKAQKLSGFFRQSVNEDFRKLDPVTQNNLEQSFIRDNLPGGLESLRPNISNDPQTSMVNRSNQLGEYFDQSTIPAFRKLPKGDQQAMRNRFIQDHMGQAPPATMAREQLGQKPQQAETSGFLGALTSGAKQTISGVRTAANVVTGDNEDVAKLTKEAGELPKTKQQMAFHEELEQLKQENGTEGLWQQIKNVASAFAAEPTGALHEVAAQLPNSVVIMGSAYAGAKAGAAVSTLVAPGVGTLVGGIAGGLVGMFMGNAGIETGFLAQDAQRKGEYDRAETLKQGAIKGGVITAIDVAGMGLNALMFKAAGNAVRKALVKAGVNPADDVAVAAALKGNRELALEVQKAGGKAALDAAPKGMRGLMLGGTALGTEMVGEGAGEYFGSMAAGLETDLTDAVMEAMMTVPQSAGTAAWSKSAAAGKTFLKGKVQTGEPEKDSTQEVLDSAGVGDDPNWQDAARVLDEGKFGPPESDVEATSATSQYKDMPPEQEAALERIKDLQEKIATQAETLGLEKPGSDTHKKIQSSMARHEAEIAALTEQVQQVEAVKETAPAINIDDPKDINIPGEKKTRWIDEQEDIQSGEDVYREQSFEDIGDIGGDPFGPVSTSGGHRTAPQRTTPAKAKTISDVEPIINEPDKAGGDPDTVNEILKTADENIKSLETKIPAGGPRVAPQRTTPKQQAPIQGADSSEKGVEISNIPVGEVAETGTKAEDKTGPETKAAVETKAETKGAVQVDGEKSVNEAWDDMDRKKRLTQVRKAGFAASDGKITAQGHDIANTQWANLSEEIQNKITGKPPTAETIKTTLEKSEIGQRAQEQYAGWTGKPQKGEELQPGDKVKFIPHEIDELSPVIDGVVENTANDGGIVYITDAQGNMITAKQTKGTFEVPETDSGMIYTPKPDWRDDLIKAREYAVNLFDKKQKGQIKQWSLEKCISEINKNNQPLERQFKDALVNQLGIDIEGGKGRRIANIHQVRAALGWSRSIFDNFIRYSNTDRLIQLHGGDPSILTKTQVEDSFKNDSGDWFFGISWRGDRKHKEVTADGEEKEIQRPDRLGEGHPGTLEGTPPEQVPGVGERRNFGTGSTEGGRPDRGGTPNVDKPGSTVPSGVGDGEGKVHVPGSGGDRGGGRGSAAESGISGVPGKSADTKDGDARRGGRARLAPEKDPEAATDLNITDDIELGAGGQKTKFKNNMAAIRLVNELVETTRNATPEEQKILAQYVGWGGLPQAFDAENSNWSKEYTELKELLSPEEYASALQSTQYAHYTSKPIVKCIYAALDRFGFTGGRMAEPGSGVGNFAGMLPVKWRGHTVMTMIERERIAGNIAKLLYPNQNVLVEDFIKFSGNDGYYDAIAGNPPFAETNITDKSGRKHLTGLSLHNYFFAKSIDMLREGGVMGMVVTNSFMDAGNKRARQYIGERAELLGAIRLPNNAFSKTANTEVTTDLIFLKKLPESEWGGKKAKDAAKAWSEIGKVPDPLGGALIPLNQYFMDHPEMMLGTMQRAGSMYGPGQPALIAGPNVDMAKALEDAVNRLPENVYESAGDRNAVEMLEQELVALEDETVDINGHYVKNDKLYQRVNDISGIPHARKVTVFDKVSDKKELGQKGLERLKALAQIRSTLRQLLAAELKSAGNMEELRAQLDNQYDAYVKKHGFINQASTLQLFKNDPDCPLLSSLEHNFNDGVGEAAAKTLGIKPVKPSAKKAPIFTQRVIPEYKPVEKADNPEDALMISLAEKGVIDTAYIGKLLGSDGEKAIVALSTGENPMLFVDPATNGYVLRDEYLSGNVRKKLKQAEAVGLQGNIEALKKALPEDVAPHEIRAKVGSPWVPVDVYESFAKELFGEDTRVGLHYVDVNSTFMGSIKAGNEIQNNSIYGTERMGGDEILFRLLNNKEIKIGDYVETEPGRKKYVLDKDATDEAIDKAQVIKEKFDDWLMSNPDRAELVAKNYNEKINNYVVRKYDGSWLRLIGKVPDSIIQLRKNQRDAAARIIMDRSALLDHVVGAGKTYTMIAAIMELKRMGLAQKQMITVPNHLVQQFAADFYRLYPGANILAPTKKDFTRENRRKLLAKIATGNWDAVIIAHSQFGFIQPPADFETRFNTHQIDLIVETIRAIKEQSDSDDKTKKRTIKQLEKLKEKLENRIALLRDRPIDSLLDFEQLGVDMIYVDEAHLFKNLMYHTQMQSVRGLNDPKGSQRAYDMYLKTQYLYEKNKGRKGVVFATGTPISNSIAEMFHMMRFLIPKELNSVGMETFDAWAKTFTETEQVWMQSLAGDGSYKSTNRMNIFLNGIELLKMYNQVADTITMEDIKKAYSDEHNGANFPIPGLKGGQRKAVSIERSQQQSEYMQDIAGRVKEMQQRKGPPQKGEDNMLSIMGDARKMAMDIRLVRPGITEREPNGRIAVAAENVFKKYKEFDHVKGTQLVFSDMGVPKNQARKLLKEYQELIDLIKPLEDENIQALADLGDKKAMAAMEKAEDAQNKMDAKGKDWQSAIEAALRGFSIYDDLKVALVEKGVAENEVAFIHDYNTDLQKAALFKAVNEGRVRVLLGSTEKLGAGTNVQERAVALHHLDVPWKPSDVEQREGRVIRQGNKLLEEVGKGFEVEVFAYATQDTLDLFMWQTQEKKLSMIGQLRTGDVGREMENPFDEMQVSAGQMQAAATSNPFLLEEITLKDTVKKLERKKRSFEGQKHTIATKKRKAEAAIKKLPGEIEEAEIFRKGARAYFAKQHARLDSAEATLNGQKITGTSNIREAISAIVNTEEGAEAKISKEKPVEYNGKNFTSPSGLAKALHEQLGDSSPISFTDPKGKLLIRRGSIKTALWNAIDRSRREKTDILVGQLGNIEVFADSTGEGNLAFIFKIENLEQHRKVYSHELSDEDLLASGVHKIDDIVFWAASAADVLKKELAQAHKDLTTIESQKEESEFSQEQELIDARTRHRQILKQLAAFNSEEKEDPESAESVDNSEGFNTNAHDPRFFRKDNGESIKLGTNVKHLQKSVDRVMDQFPGLKKDIISVNQSESQLPDKVQAALKKQGMTGKYEAMVWEGKIYLVADNLTKDSFAELSVMEGLMRHEGRHLAIEKIFEGKEGRDKFFGLVAERYSEDISAHLKKHGIEDTTDNRIIAAEEVIIDRIRAGETGGIIDRFIAKVIEFLRRLFPNLKISSAEVRELIAHADKIVEGKDEVTALGQPADIANDDIRFSREAGPVDEGGTAKPLDSISEMVLEHAEAHTLPGNMFLRLVESVTDRLRRSKSPLMTFVAEKVDKYYDQTDKRLGWWNGKLRPHINAVPQRQRKQLWKDFESYWRHLDNGRSVEAQEVLHAAHPELSRMIETVKDLFVETGKINQTIRQQEGRPDPVDIYFYDHGVYRQVRAEKHFWNDKLNEDLKEFPQEQREDISSEFQQYWQAIGRQDHNFAKQILDTTPGLKEFIKKTKARVRVEQQSGMMVYDSSLDGYRPIKKTPRAKFYPRMIGKDVSRVLNDTVYRTGKGKELWGQMIEALLEDGHINNPDEAVRYLKNYFSKEIANDYFAGVEKARQKKLPEMFYDYSTEALSRYAYKWANRVSQVEQFGQSMGKDAPDIFDELMEHGFADNRTKNYMEQIAAQVYQKRQYDTILGAMDCANIFATATQLGNPATATLNILGGSILSWQLFGTKNMLMSLKDLVFDWKGIQQRGVEYGILGKDLMNIMNDTERQAGSLFQEEAGIKGALSKFANFTMTWGGYRGTENIIRTHAMIAAQYQLQDALNAWNKNPGGIVGKKYRDLVERNGIDADKLLAESGSGEETSKYLRKMVNIPQGSYRIDQTPLYVDTRIGRFLFKYQKFGTQVSRMFYMNYLKPFMEAKTGPQRFDAFMGLMGFFAKGIAGGSLVLATRAALFGYRDPGPDDDDLKQAFENDDFHRGFGLVASRAFHNMMAASALGFYGNYVNFVLDVSDQQRPKNPFDPPALSTIKGMQELVMTYLDQGTLTGQDVDKYVQSQLALYRGYKRAGASIFGAMGSEWKEAKLFEAEAERRYARSAAMQFARETGVERKRAGTGAPVKTPRTPLNQELYNLLTLGDGQAARALVRNAMKGKTRKERNNLMASFRSSARARQPLNIQLRMSEKERQQFYQWGRKNLAPSNFNRIRQADQKYRLVMMQAGLLENIGWTPSAL